MAHLGGGAEAHADLPTGEPETLWGRIDPRSFGDRAYRGRPAELDEKINKAKRKKKERDAVSEAGPTRQAKRRRLREESVLTSTEEGVYQPKTKETRAAYEAMLSVIQQQLGGQPLNIVSAAADEILAVLKNESLRLLVTDYQDAGDGAGASVANGDDALDDGVGVAVEFDEDNEDEEEDSDLDMVPEEEEEEDDVVEPGGSGAMQMGGGIDDDETGEANEGMNLNVQDIDAYWLQRKISQAYEQQIDPQQCQKLAEEVLKILAEGDDREVETKLLVHLQFDKFSLIKFLLRNRLKIVVTRAKDQEERKQIEEEMMGLGPDLAGILEQLHATRATAKERQKNLEKSIREEARRLKDETGGDGDRDRDRRGLVDRDAESGWVKGQPQLLDLDSIAFDQGGLLMANKKCDLPVGSFKHQKKAKAIPPDERFVKISEMPDWAQPAFKGMQQLNRVQADNVLLCAPTGAGKTNVAVLTILQQIALNRNPDGSFNNNNYKIVYVAPMKALVAEVVGVWCPGEGTEWDKSMTRQQIEETQIIVTTPEKWDIITRKSGDRTYTQLVKLLIIDEIHLLHDNRGPVLESIVARTVRQIEATKEHIRLLSPVPLSQQYIGINIKKPLQRFQLMNDICYEKVMDVAGKHQVLIFVHSRKETSKTARAIRDTALGNDTLSRFLREDSASREILQTHTELVKSNDLKDLLPMSDRQLVEDLFADDVQVLVSTRLSLLHCDYQGTQIYNPEKGAWTELSPLDVMQMLGRAGRPQYDSYGEGIIITGHSELQYYLSLMNQQLPIESQFISKLADQLNAEIVLGTVQNAREACHWLGYTYLYIRMLRNPTLYGLTPDVLTRDITLEERRADLASIKSFLLVFIHSAAAILDKNNLSSMTEEWIFSGTDLVPSAKINVLLQAYISQLKLEGLSLTSDMVFITQSAGRLMRALFEIVLKRGWAQLAEKALNLCKMVNKRMWSVQTPLRQFHGIPNEILMKLEKKDLRLVNSSVSQDGRTLYKFIHCSTCSAHHTHCVEVELTITADFQWEDNVHGYVEPFWVIVEDNDGDYILHHEYFMLKKQYVDEHHVVDLTLNFTVPIYEPLPPQYFIRVVSDKWLGSQTASYLARKISTSNRVAGLAALPVTALRNPSYEALYQDFKHFNPVQTQVFTVLYNTDDTGSGKTICAEFAILRNHHKGPESVMRAVYIAPLEAIAKERYRDWERKFGRATDLKLLEKGQIIISTPEKWDALSRRWKQRKYVQQVSLFIIDELHLIGGQGGPVLEVIVSRMRYIASQIENKIRIVALSSSLANAKDLEWIGATSHGLCASCAPGNTHSSMQRMKARDCVCPTRKHVRLAAVDLMTYSSMDGGEKPPFLLRSIEEMEPFLGKIQEEMLRATLHHGLSSLDQEVVSQLLKLGGFSTFVSTFGGCDGYSVLRRQENALHRFLQMMGHASRPLLDNSGIVAGVIENKQDAVDYLTWTFTYRRLTQNPNYYNLQGVSHRHLSDHLSELVENTLTDLERSKCVAIEEDMDLSPLNLGMIAVCTTAIRPGEDEVLRRLINHQRFSFENPRYADPHVKANVLLQAHFSRQSVGGNLALDQREVLLSGSRLLQAMVDVISSNGWLSLALLAMEVSQMVTQGIWERDSMLLQLPHFTKDMAKKCQENPGKSIETVFDLVEMEDDESGSFCRCQIHSC
uniref:U5 small nuclear ribonucleoprotein 200 kDa helicase n=1 Tax=Salix viminalis TaxID=40686 RepID=A0A6N2K3P8_SALVM